MRISEWSSDVCSSDLLPGLRLSTDMPMINAVGTSLVAVTAFGLTTAANYAFSGMVDWPLAGIFILGGVAGGFFGTMLAKRLSGSGALTKLGSGSCRERVCR